jgi:hypothetical protein
MTAKTSPLMIEVTSNGQPIGRLTPEDLRHGLGRPNYDLRFLPALVDEFNGIKARLGEPERARITLK